MAQYLLSVCFDQEYPSGFDLADPDVVRPMNQVDALNEEMTARGVWVFAGGLEPASTATVVRSNGREVSMTDGPYAETKEQMGGFWVIDVADLDAALEWAGRATTACERPIEVRPFQG
jgi:hypothetical protein